MTVSPAAPPPSVRTAIAAAAERTGADFSYLVATARRESGFDAGADARTSSAAGLFQFIEQTWLGMVKRHGADHGLGHLADRIEEDGGRFRVADPAVKADILDLRYDPDVAAVMAGEYAGESAQMLAGRLGREPGARELYAAHFLGPAGAARLIEAAESDPAMRADTLFPAAARANRSIFFKGGEAASVAEVLETLGAHHGGEAAPARTAEAGASHPAAPRRDFGGAAAAWAPPRVTARVLSPLVIEALAALDTPGRDRRDA